MAQLTLTIPDNQVARVRAMVTDVYNTPVEDISVAEVKMFVIGQLKSAVSTFEGNEAERNARAAVEDIDVT